MSYTINGKYLNNNLIENLDIDDNLYIKHPNNEQKGIIIASNDKQNHGYICQQIKEIIEKYDIFPLN